MKDSYGSLCMRPECSHSHTGHANSCRTAADTYLEYIEAVVVSATVADSGTDSGTDSDIVVGSGTVMSGIAVSMGRRMEEGVVVDTRRSTASFGHYREFGHSGSQTSLRKSRWMRLPS